MKLSQPSKDASSKIRMRVSQDWVQNLIVGIVRIFTDHQLAGQKMLDFTVNELNRKGIYIIPTKED